MRSYCIIYAPSHSNNSSFSPLSILPTVEAEQDALTEIGAKHNFKSKEVVSKFFHDLKAYEAARVGDKEPG